MSLWDDDDDFEEYVEDENPYIAKPELGLQLIASLLNVDKNAINHINKMKRIDTLIDKRLLQSISQVNLNNELELYQQLIQLSDKLFEQNKMKLLEKKMVIGIGGKFSAGKSKFINSLLQSNFLPEAQSPTTSIATYLVQGKEETVSAYTKYDRKVPITMEAANALTHAFYDKYNLGFSQFINNLVMTIPSFQYKQIALLDTPGYSKSDSSIVQNVSDEHKAFTQLRSVDRLIWLVDIENGIIQQDDIEFIESLNLTQPVLIVFNKADKKSTDDVERVIEESKEILRMTNIPIFEVIAYSALETKEFRGTNYLVQFMDEIEHMKQSNDNVYVQIIRVIERLQNELIRKKQAFRSESYRISDVIFKSADILEIKTLTESYAAILEDIKECNYAMKSLDKTFKTIEELLQQI
ncbi:dynamin family protein [Ectobacillus sp. sgz5001026]|uniref:dynamin family protein n=1 Tax=Ectobacillus sp. sgz5001026 TaxID=3242473 RepID=UPI0036D23220